jgi:hypothetical protein
MNFNGKRFVYINCSYNVMHCTYVCNLYLFSVFVLFGFSKLILLLFIRALRIITYFHFFQLHACTSSPSTTTVFAKYLLLAHFVRYLCEFNTVVGYIHAVPCNE